MLIKGDCIAGMATLPDDSIDAVVSDPPYELNFMGRGWDNSGIAFNPDMWAQCYRVLKPGAYLLAFGGSRTIHRIALAIENAGFIIEDSMHWTYGSGFPKSLNISKAMDKDAGAVREVIGQRTTGLGTGKGTTAIMGDGNRDITAPATPEAIYWEGWGTALKPSHEPIVVARKPADFPLEPTNFSTAVYCPKPTVEERDRGLEGFEAVIAGVGALQDHGRAKQPKRNIHPTVKPTNIMRYLVDLVTPQGGTVLDPFLGSGTTAVAATLERRNWVGCELTPEYWEIIEARVQWAKNDVGWRLF
jgi:site-specific DNA-methyltransferase (adenine-specific)